MAGSLQLPSEIMHNILSRLPMKFLLRILIVSKSWYAIIRDPYFMELHMYRSGESQSDNRYVAYYKSGFCKFFELENELRELFEFECPFFSPSETIYPTCSCNGVLLFQIEDGGIVTDCLIWNPFARKWRRVKCPHRAYKYNLCYDESRDDLKIVGFNAQECIVYSCKNDTWELKKLREEVCCVGAQISFRGAIYLINAQEVNEYLLKPAATHMARYDPSSDVLQYFRTPYRNVRCEDSFMTSSKESLYFYAKPSHERWWYCTSYFVIWVMKDDHSWEELMKIDRVVVERMNWPTSSLHFHSGSYDYEYIIETGYMDFFAVDSRKGYKCIGNVLGDVKGGSISHPINTLYFPTLASSSPFGEHMKLSKTCFNICYNELNHDS